MNQIKIIAINLPTRTDRRRDLERGLGEVGIDTQSVVWYPAIDPESPAGFANPGYRGCFLSHVAVLNIAQNLGWPEVLILEDDCEFFSGFPSALKQALARTDWGICYPGHGEQPEPGQGTLAVWPPESRVILSHCYMVRQPVLPSLCRYLEAMALRPAGDPRGGPMSPDGALSWFRKDHPEILTLLAAPTAALQRSSRSDVTPRFHDRVPGVRDIAAIARRIRLNRTRGATRQ
jgi:glycosyl transferase, family 25